jgi:hypothetical protein
VPKAEVQRERERERGVRQKTISRKNECAMKTISGKKEHKAAST